MLERGKRLYVVVQLLDDVLSSKLQRLLRPLNGAFDIARQEVGIFGLKRGVIE